MDLLNISAPLISATHSKFMTQELSKAIMLRTRFRHQFLKMKISEAKAKYNKQRNICVSLTRKAKRNYICDNKKIWATVKPLFSNKIKSAENIVLSENGKLIKDEEEVVNIFNDFFVNILPSLGIRTQHEFLSTTDKSQDPIENAICKSVNHPNNIFIKKYMEGTNSSFAFKTVTKEKLRN